MMRTMILAIVVILLALSLVLSSCRVDEDRLPDSSRTKQDIVQTTEGNIPTPENSTNTDPVIEPTAEEKSFIDLSGSDYFAKTIFSEGLAWVNYDSKASVVTNSGEIAFQLPVSARYATPFVNGLSLLVTADLDEVIIDSIGNELYIALKTDEIKEHILLYGKDLFLVMRHITNMTGNHYELGSIDKTGTYKAVYTFSGTDLLFKSIIKRFDDMDEALVLSDYSPMFEHIGNNVFFYSEDQKCSAFFSLNTGLFYDKGINYGNGTFDGILTTYLGRISDDTSWVLRVGLSDVGYGIINTSQGLPHYNKVHNTAMDSARSAYCVGKYFFADRVLYDTDGRSVSDITIYPDLGFKLYSFTDDGYAPIVFSGKDGNYYVTFINEAGEEMFTPVKAYTEALICYGANRFAITNKDGSVSVYNERGNHTEITTGLFDPTKCENVGEDYIIIANRYYFYSL